MGTIYLCIVIFLLCVAVFNLFVGVINVAGNFLQSAIGAKVAKFRTVLIIASCGVVLGAIIWPFFHSLGLAGATVRQHMFCPTSSVKDMRFSLPSRRSYPQYM